MDYLSSLNTIKLSKDEQKEVAKIISYESLKLANGGSNDLQGYQIFTPKFIVEDMVKAIGIDAICDFDNTILEPTSGDGAFTTYILNLRLNKAFEDKQNFEINALKALSTIYSIEMDYKLVKIQRNNIFTVFNLFAKENDFTYSNGFLEIVKMVIVKNFIWAMFNSDDDITMLACDVAYSMPEANQRALFSDIEGNKKSIKFPVWRIDNDINYRMEYPEVGL